MSGVHCQEHNQEQRTLHRYTDTSTLPEPRSEGDFRETPGATRRVRMSAIQGLLKTKAVLNSNNSSLESWSPICRLGPPGALSQASEEKIKRQVNGLVNLFHNILLVSELQIFFPLWSFRIELANKKISYKAQEICLKGYRKDKLRHVMLPPLFPPHSFSIQGILWKAAVPRQPPLYSVCTWRIRALTTTMIFSFRVPSSMRCSPIWTNAVLE